MNKEYDLHRFLKAQETSYKTALSEIKNGRKLSHWMWYIFPQLKGLGMSETARYYGIEDLNEAAAYSEHPILGKRLVEISSVLLTLNTKDPNAIFGSSDDLKLKSSITLFNVLQKEPVFEEVLIQFFNGAKDSKTLQLLGMQK